MSDKLRVGITGSDGNVGTTLRAGLSEDFDLRLYTLDTVDYESTVADLSDASQVEGIFDGLDCLIHLAAYIHATGTWEQILPNNIIATQNVLAEAVRAGVKKVVFASTNHTQHGFFMVDGKPNITDPETERLFKLNDVPHPDSIYGVSKLFGENLGRYYVTTSGIQFVALKIGWTREDDDCTALDGTVHERHLRALYLSKRDCVQAFRKAVEVDTDYLVAYATSDNRQYGIFDLEESIEKLGFHPEDSSDR
ncbi:MAG: NAD(P)-dependent oxidoreductase [Opitutales bacterium]|jgi:NAD+ dependent glucose-6-phosphate dehydrogenase|nr:NAD(P)-dependent oxidoreductase [Opitutales bacterium]